MKWMTFLSLVGLFFLQCDTPNSNPQQSIVDTTKTMASQVNPPSPPPPAKSSISTIEQQGQTMAVSSFNQSVVAAQSEDATWINSPILVALKFCGEDMECRKKSIELESKDGESFDELRVVIEEEGYLDDSLKGSIVILRMVKKQGLWQITKATQAWNCWQGRGHQDYSTEPCG